MVEVLEPTPANVRANEVACPCPTLLASPDLELDTHAGCARQGGAPDVCSNCRIDGDSRFRIYECELCPAGALRAGALRARARALRARALRRALPRAAPRAAAT